MDGCGWPRTWVAGPATRPTCWPTPWRRTTLSAWTTPTASWTSRGATASNRVSFRLHDITTGPFPCGPYDLLFSRFELTHLQCPEAVVDLWGRQLDVGGLLLMEEVEYVGTTHPAFISYLDIQQAMLTEQGNSLYIGPVLNGIPDSDSLKRRSSGVRAVGIPASRAAAMFHMNLGVWRHNDFVRRTYDQSGLDELESSLAAVASGRADASPVEWGLRRMIMERTEPRHAT